MWITQNTKNHIKSFFLLITGKILKIIKAIKIINFQLNQLNQTLVSSIHLSQISFEIILPVSFSYILIHSCDSTSSRLSLLDGSLVRILPMKSTICCER